MSLDICLSTRNSYVCAFRGRRDRYQIPCALQEHDQLDQLITDIYATPFLRRVSEVLPPPWDEKLYRRHDPALPATKVRCMWTSAIREQIRHVVGISEAETFAVLDPLYSRAAARRARKTRSHLLLYTPYAWEAFNTEYPHSPRRVLFQYHPHTSFEEKLLEKDAGRFGELDFDTDRRADTGTSLTPAQKRRTREAWKQADQIICASTFTQRTLEEVGASPDICEVVPYGVDLPDQPSSDRDAPDRFDVLFVGAGVQRKGLHHLLYAWRKADLPGESALTLVCRTLDPALEPLIDDTSRTTLHRGVSYQKLIELYRNHTLFAMPSLIEGFGQVYLEALSQGCPVLGTPNTCLPDVRARCKSCPSVINSVEPGNIVALSRALERLSLTLSQNRTVREEARNCAERFTWPRFRSGIGEVV